MSDIELPVIHKFTTSTGEYQHIDGYITITPGIARQIVALSAVPAFEANTLQRLASIEDHCNRMLELTKMGLQNNDSLKNIRSVLEAEPFLGEAHQSELEKAHATPVDAGVAKDRRLSGVKILPSERNKNDWPQGDYVNQCCECKETFLGQKRSCACRACVEKKGQEHFTQPPVDAGGEDAAVEAIRLVMGTKAWDSYVDYAKNVVQLIRAGKVPNIVDATVLSDERGLLAGQYEEIATLRARLADAERRADEMEGKAGEWIAVDVHKERVRAAIADCKAMNERLLGERDAFGKEGKRAQDAEKELRARVAELEAGLLIDQQRVSEALEERDRLAARVAGLEKERARCDNPVLAILDQQHETVVAERDRALGDLAAVSSAIGTCAFMDPPDGGSPTLAEQVGRMRAALDKADADLAAERERAFDAGKRLTDMAEELATFRARMEEAEACYHVGPCMVELAAARAEAAALKARTVKLPPYNTCADVPNFADGFAHGRAAVIDAIRAAGVEVEP